MHHTSGCYRMYQYWLIWHHGHQYDCVSGDHAFQSQDILIGLLDQAGLIVSCGVVQNLRNICHEI